MNKLKIVHIVHQFFPLHCLGAELSTYDLAKAQMRDGHSVTIMAGEYGHLFRELKVEEIRYEDLPVLRLYFNPRTDNGFLAHKGIYQTVRRIFEQIKPDVVHIQHLENLSLSVIKAAKDLKIPTVLTLRDYALICSRIKLLKGDGTLCRKSDFVHDCMECLKQSIPISSGARLRAGFDLLRVNLTNSRVWRIAISEAFARIAGRKPPLQLNTPDDFKLRNREVRSALESIDVILAITKDIAQRFHERSGIRNSVIPIPQSPDTRQCQRSIRQGTNGIPRFGFIGKFTRIKGIEVLLRAFRMLPPDSAELHLFGSPTWTNLREIAYYNEMRQLGNYPGVLFHGSFSKDRLKEAFDSFDVLVVPSIWWEAFGRVVAEAQASGVPVICSDEGGPAELIQHRKNGLLFKIGDAEDLARALRELIENSSEIERMSRNSVLPKTMEDYIKEIEQTYLSIIGSDRFKSD